MGVSELNKKIASSTTGGQTEACKTCPSAGLPILLTRYGIDPSSKEGAPPTFTNNYKPAKLGSACRQLRVLRPGFVYVALQYDSAPKKVYWMCYWVDADGMFKEIPIAAPPPTENKIACNRLEHSVHAALIAIPAPDFVHTAHLAYAEYQWEQSTLDDYEKIILGGAAKPGARRSIERFVSFSPKAWVSTSANLSSFPNIWVYTKVFQVFEYKYGLTETAANELANRTGFQCKPRTSGRQLMERMNALRPGRGMVLALPDPLGEAKELNVLRMDAVQTLRAYSTNEDNQWKLQSAQLIDGIRTGIEKVAEQQTKEDMIKQQRSRTRQTYKGLKASNLKRGLEPIQGEYDEKARATFVTEFYAEIEKRRADTVAKDIDYVAAVSEAHLALALTDYDSSTVVGRACATVAGVNCFVGGGLTDESLEWWRQMLERKVTDPLNYGVRFSLGDVGPIINALTLRETGLFTWLWEQDSGSRIKAVDLIRNTVLSDTMKAKYLAASPLLLPNVLNTIDALKRRYELQKNKLSVANENVKKALAVSKLKMTEAGYASLGALQKNLARAFQTYNSGLHTVTLKLEGKAEDVAIFAEAFGDHPMKVAAQETSMRKLKPGEQGAKPNDRYKIEHKKNFYTSMKDYALNDAQLAKGIKNGLAEIEFVVMATRANMNSALTDILIKELDSKVAANKTATGRAISVVESSASEKIQALRQLGKTIAETELPERLTRLGNHAGKVATADVSFTGVAIYFNYWHLSNMTQALINAGMFDTDEARVAFSSAVLGAAGVHLEMLGKVGNMIKAFDGAGSKATGKVAEVAASRASSALAGFGATSLGEGLALRAGALIGIGTILGSFAVALDSVQMGMVAKDSAFSGDVDSAIFNGFGALAFGASAAALFVSAGASGGIAALSGLHAGFIVLFGVNPLVAGLVLLAVGVVCAYLAWNAKDKPLTTWIKRSRFGDNEKDRFKSMKEEIGALQLVSLGFEIHLRWDDRPIADLPRNAIFRSDLPEEVTISISYPVQISGTLVYGLVVAGKGGQACFTPVSVGALSIDTLDLPRIFDPKQCPRYDPGSAMPERDGDGGGYNNSTVVVTGVSVVSGQEVKVYRAVQRQGAGFERENEIGESDISGLKKDKDHAVICKVEHVFQVDVGRFDRAELHIRYFPDGAKPKEFFDTMYPVRD